MKLSTLTINPGTMNKQEQHELLEEVRKKYPIGTMVDCAFGNKRSIHVNEYKVNYMGVWTASNCWLAMKYVGFDMEYATIIDTRQIKPLYKIY